MARKRKIKKRKLIRSKKKRKYTRCTGATKSTAFKNQQYVFDYLLSHPCVDCGERSLLLLEFDHLDRKTKLGTVSSLLHLSLEVVQEEIAKCQVLCVRCHKIKTAFQLNWKNRISRQESRTDGFATDFTEHRKKYTKQRKNL